MLTQSHWGHKLSILDKRIKAFADDYRQNIVIFGNDRDEISLLLDDYFSSNYFDTMNFARVNCVYLNRKEFFKNVTISILSNHTKCVDSLDNLINQTRQALPETVKYIQNTLRHDNIEFTQVLEVINKISNESNKKCVFLLEEFLNLKDIFPDYFDAFSKFIIMQRNCMVVLTSSHTKEGEKIISLNLNLLFGNFEKIFINEQGFIDAYHAIKNLIRPIEASPSFISFFVNIIGDNYLHQKLMAQTIKENYCREEENALISIVTASLYTKESYFFRKFSEKIEAIPGNFKDKHEAIAILRCLAHGYLRKNELNALNICETKKTKTYLPRLCDIGYIAGYGNIYKIIDPLFSFWIDKSFAIHFHRPSVDILGQKRLWQAMIKEEISVYSDNFRRNNVAKISELIAAFNDDKLRLGKNYYKLPAVKRIKTIPYPDQNLNFLIAEGERIIFLGIKENNTQDQDIFEFIEKGRSINGRGVKKIFVALDKPSHGARLAAKNNRLEIWDIDTVNDLMRIYNKPLILAE